MKILLLIACLAFAGCAIPEVIYIERGYSFEPVYRGNIVDPLEQRDGGMSFMCRNAINRGDSGAAFIFCK